MTPLQIVELVVAGALLVGGIALMRRPAKDGTKPDSQSAVILIVIGAIIAVHGLGLMNYRPSQSELESRP